MRVVYVLEGLSRIVPAGVEETGDLAGDVEGDLWEMNENLMVVNGDVCRKITDDAGSSEARKVRILMTQTGLAPVT